MTRLWGNPTGAHCHAPLLVSEHRYRCAEMRFWRVRERFDDRVIPQRLVDAGTLHPNPSSMNQADFPQPGLMRRSDVFLNY
jgi:hypothetical protein